MACGGALAERADDWVEVDGPWSLPDGWAWAEAQSFANVVGGGTPSDASDPVNFDADGVPWITPADLSGYSGSTIRKGARSLSPTGLHRSSTQMLPAGSVLISSRAPVGYCVVAEGPVCTNQGFKSLRLKAPIDPFFIRYFVLYAKRRLNDAASGTTFRELSGRAMEQIVFPLAPLAEQRRIVARVDALFAEIAEGEAALAEARKGLDTFRRALLKAAVTGELTKDWRAESAVSETGLDILNRLRKCHPNASPTRAGWRPKSELPILPENWTWCAIEEAGEVQLGRQRAPQHHDGDNMRPYLRVANVLENRLDLSDVKWMNFTPAEFKTFALRPGDILLNEGQAPDLLGRPAMYQGEIVECCFQKTLLRFRAKDGVLPDYALIVFRHYMRSGRFKRESRITTNIGHLTQVRFAVMEFPLPPEAEQRAIVDLFRENEAAATDVLAVLDAEAADAARLKQSILKAAFEGRLAAQNPVDEPASALLDRLAAQRATTDAKRRLAKRVS
jgi:type I restriction enzyme, S subunit